MSENAAIVVRGLTRKFGQRTAVDRLDLEVKEGRIFGFLGPNGAGKTTTIRMLTGILRPTGGEGSVMGYDIATQSEEIKQRIGYVAQHFGLYDNLTVEENLGFYSEVYGGAEKGIIEGLIDRYGFSGHRKTLAKNLSGGFKQRLSLICALTHSPRMIFLDEPTAGVDPTVRKELWDFFYELSHDGTTLFVTTHYMEEAERCDRLAFIHAGKLTANDTPDGIRNSLADRDVFAVHSRYDTDVIEKAKKLTGIETVNQFGQTLRLVIEKGRYDEAKLLEALGLPGDPETAVLDRPTIEDVFVNLTGRMAPAVEGGAS